MSATDTETTILEAVTTAEQAEREQKAIEQAAAAVDVVVSDAENLTIATPNDAAAAAKFLGQIASIRKENEKARKELVKPLNDHVKMINQRFKDTDAPLDQADGIVRPKLLAWQQEQERIRQAEQARLQAEAAERQRQEEEARRAAEQAAAAERAKAEAAAAEVRRQAEEAEARRRAELSAAAGALADRAAQQTDERLAFAAERDDEFGEAARREINARAERAEAERQAAAAAAEAEAARQRQEAADAAPVVAHVAPVLAETKAPEGVQTKKRWVAEVVDASAVPREFLVVDQKAINAAMRAGVRDIPGVEIKQVDELAVRS